MAHPYQQFRNSSQTRVKQVLKADGGAVPTPSGEEMNRAKNYMRGVVSLGKGTWSGKDAFQYGAEDAKQASDRMRSS